MDTKLTLKLNSHVIGRAKIYARKKNTSLSQLIETYLDYLTNPQEGSEKITPLVKSLSGIIQLPEKYDSKRSYRSHILKKYGD